MFLNNAARQSYAQTQMLNELRRHRISDIMDRTLPLADANATTAEGLRMVSTGNSALHVARGDLRRPIFVADDERVVGAVTAWDMYRVDEARRDSVTLREIMTETRKVPFVDASADAATVLQRMEADEISHMPVVEDGRLVGIVSRDEIVKLLGRRQFLQR
jgi:CBS domain-containing protein